MDVKLSADGRVSVFNSQGTVDVIMDVVGFYEPPAADPGSGYQVVTKAGTVPANGFLSDGAACPAGKVPVGGGVLNTSAPVLGNSRIVQSFANGSVWSMLVENVGTPAFTVTLQAICMFP